MKSHHILGPVLALTLTTCGGGGGGDGGVPVAGIGGTGAPSNSAWSTGTINGFGSIFVNGIEFETGQATIIVDGVLASEADLKLGMVVTVSGAVDSQSSTGTALKVEFDDSIQGPVAAINTNLDLTVKELSILGSTVLVEDGVVVFDGVTFDTLAVGNLLEVSGFYDSHSVLHATRIEKKAGTEVELKGLVSSVDIGAMTFTMGSYSVNYSSADTGDLPGAAPAVAMPVEVKGTLAGLTITATQVELAESSYGDDGDRVSIEGLVTQLNVVVPDRFTVSGTAVDFSSAEFVPETLQSQLANNLKVEVQGVLKAGVLEASRIESRSAAAAVKAPVQSVSGSVISLSVGNGQSVSFTVDQQTRFYNDRNNTLLTLDAISPGDYLEVSLVDYSGGYVAAEVTLDEPDHEVVQGPVDAFTPGIQISVLGVSFSFDGDTEFEDENDQELSSAQFFSRVSVGDTVKIGDERPGNGVADEVEFE